MTPNNIANIRIVSQQIAGTEFRTAKELVAWMGAMQAQDYNMMKWALGMRLPGSTEQSIETAIDKGEIIRTHLLRPTWHIVSAEDIYWILELTTPHIKSTTKSRLKDLELTEGIIAKSYKIMVNALSGGNHLTRDELMTLIEKEKIRTNENRLSHLLMEAELHGLICSGASKGKKHTFALLEERVPKSKNYTRTEALAELAKRYFSSHCPATMSDFQWWSGLPVRDARSAVDSLGKDFVSEKIGTKTYWFTNTFKDLRAAKTGVYLLPAYDEYLISYRDRSASLAKVDNPKAISNNGIFRPVIVKNGQVIGLWRKVTKRDKIEVETELFLAIQDKSTKSQVENAIEKFKEFYQK